MSYEDDIQRWFVAAEKNPGQLAEPAPGLQDDDPSHHLLGHSIKPHYHCNQILKYFTYIDLFDNIY
jgi:hypothetical protein